MVFRSLSLMIAMAMPALAFANNCEALRAQIEAKIAAAGVSQFSVTVVEASAASSGGQVVGSCAQGTKKIVYTRAAAQQVLPAASAPARKAKPRKVLTECKDGTVSVDGNCR